MSSRLIIAASILPFFAGCTPPSEDPSPEGGVQPSEDPSPASLALGLRVAQGGAVFELASCSFFRAA